MDKSSRLLLTKLVMPTTKNIVTRPITPVIGEKFLVTNARTMSVGRDLPKEIASIQNLYDNVSSKWHTATWEERKVG